MAPLLLCTYIKTVSSTGQMLIQLDLSPFTAIYLTSTNFLSDVLAAIVLAVVHNTRHTSAAPSRLLDRLNPNPNTRVNDEFRQFQEQPAATDAPDESVESLFETNTANTKDDEDDQNASNAALRSKRNVVTSSTEAYEDSYIPVCSPCHGDSEYMFPCFVSQTRIDG